MDVQLFGALVESGVGEQNAHMLAMESAICDTRNVIICLTGNNNRARQASMPTS